MTTYHAHGSLYIKSANATQATTLYNAINTRATGTGKAFTNYRNFNEVVKETLADGTIHLYFSIRFNAAADMDYVATQGGGVANRLNLDYCSYISYHVCHHDEFKGIEKPTYIQWGACKD